MYTRLTDERSLTFSSNKTYLIFPWWQVIIIAIVKKQFYWHPSTSKEQQQNALCRAKESKIHYRKKGTIINNIPKVSSCFCVIQMIPTLWASYRLSVLKNIITKISSSAYSIQIILNCYCVYYNYNYSYIYLFYNHFLIYLDSWLIIRLWFRGNKILTFDSDWHSYLFRFGA